jgi:hypothetical protein
MHQIYFNNYAYLPSKHEYFYKFLVKMLVFKNDPSEIFSAHFFVVQYCAIACNKAVNLQIYKDNFLPLLLFDKPFGPIHLRIQPAYYL